MRATDHMVRATAYWLENLVIRGIILAVRLLPWRLRGHALGWVVRRMIGPLAGWNKRARANLDYVWPEMATDRKREIVNASLSNIGKLFAEIYDPAKLRAVAASAAMEGPGKDAVLDALRKGRPVLLAGGHYGNYEVPKAALAELGHPIAMIYKRADNPFFHRHYWAAMRQISGPIFEKGDSGTSAFFDHVAQGKPAAILFDVRVRKGEVIPFLNKPAATATTAAWLANKHDSLLVPFWAIRTDTECGFKIFFDRPVEHSDPVAMTKSLNRSLEDRINEDPGQWLWSHRRWKL
ncbi:MAG: lysophospholipid acyltransferase family protein [Ruegeria sp.]